MNATSLLRRWTVATAVGLSIGMGTAFAAFLARPSEQLTYAIWGLPGIWVAIGQMIALPLARSHPARWLLAGAAASSIGIPGGIGLGLVAIMAIPARAIGPDGPIPTPAFQVLIVLIPYALAGLLAGLVLGAIQAPVFPAIDHKRTKWVLYSSAAWLVAGALMGALFLVAGSSSILSPAARMEWLVWLLLTILFGAIAGVVAGIITCSGVSLMDLANASNAGIASQDAA